MNLILDSEKADTNENSNEKTSSSEVTLDTNTNENSNDKPTDEIEKNKVDNESMESSSLEKESIDFKVIYNKKKINVSFALDGTVAELKAHLQNIISVPKDMQKVMIKGLAKDEQTLRSLGVTSGAKVMIVGSKLDDILALSNPTKQQAQEDVAAATSKEPLSQQKIHRKILEKGIPEDAMPGILEAKVMSNFLREILYSKI